MLVRKADIFGWWNRSLGVIWPKVTWFTYTAIYTLSIFYSKGRFSKWLTESQAKSWMYLLFWNINLLWSSKIPSFQLYYFYYQILYYFYVNLLLVKWRNMSCKRRSLFHNRKDNKQKLGNMRILSGERTYVDNGIVLIG